jgi:hypothetical protein
MLALLSAVVAVGCILASARRLAWAVAPTSLDASLLLRTLRGSHAPPLAALRNAVLSRDDLGWERDVFRALAEPDARSRDALVDEQRLELDWAAQRWARVPRVCASISTSAGFLFGSVALLRGLELPADEGATPALGATLVAALNALAIGIAGTAFCVAVHIRARRVVRERLSAAERLVDDLTGKASRQPSVQ